MVLEHLCLVCLSARMLQSMLSDGAGNGSDPASFASLNTISHSGSRRLPSPNKDARMRRLPKYLQCNTSRL